MSNFESLNFFANFDDDLFQSKVQELFLQAEIESIQFNSLQNAPMVEQWPTDLPVDDNSQKNTINLSHLTGDSFVWSKPVVTHSPYITRQMWVLPMSPDSPYDWKTMNTPLMSPVIGMDSLPQTPMITPDPFLDIQLPYMNNPCNTLTSTFSACNPDHVIKPKAPIKITGRRYKSRTNNPRKKSVEAECPLCLDIFTRKHDVKRHIRVVHPDEVEIIKSV